MQLSKLLAPILLKKITDTIDTLDITGITADSRKACPGCLFVALKGHTVDGHDFVAGAVEQGAVAAVVEREVEGLPVPQIIVHNTRDVVPILASTFYRHPSHSMKVIGVTGTNGKTTVTNLIDKILTDQGHRTGLIGTIKNRIGNQEYDAANTTPEALELQETFHRMKEFGTEYVAMEVSSHALDLKRVAGTRFRTAVFTNLTQDHLDFHGSMEKYRNAKGKFFSQLGNTYEDRLVDNRFAVINADDPEAGFFIGQTVAQVVTYGIDKEADVRGLNVQIEAGGASFTLASFAGSIDLHLQMTGKFSVYNALAAAAACLCEGVGLSAIKASLESVSGVDGRFERVVAGQDFTVIVDYAHTPDSLENVLKTIREFAKGKVYTVVGCGGDRDRTKRPIMARIAAAYSDVAIITSDNPRTEDPEKILDDMEQGLTDVSRDRYVRLTDRKDAIRHAVGQAVAGDVVLIAGKGHETYQIIGTTKHHFDDREVAVQAIRGEL
ncbi:UDP-N-acetylmuramoyl-L-alanyl-D-glutamate--2,6-diaminopimelate ligase [Effusibacillus lacus]|uniref:UDP-N-acetylmuramoyl-L-alanyl-D-glutamate--2,6-diaminopimelate ligase n=1 Tax=Effusibacillus lacus TaxID=1348429 RepID=A0A292YQ29_9BACL|nr:UDP-N-acetylmuramoyl-L-alanyl-D-glutamate--2,6-diaminopimelate ligase [Effusibacillus lacus]TCS75690.1 UDP-N-acetylmuramoylalanyl-D-glutamate--2,6-diaminopimelate ligase [Effusibacillus lacus]GAX91011.1 UDP-N-acetylmuramoyl-L-alanyl-D-glutamate--2,6-diaminopimelate ligase [Effusibacillus lacus]